MFSITIRTNENETRTFLVSRFDLIKQVRTWAFLGHTPIAWAIYN